MRHRSPLSLRELLLHRRGAGAAQAVDREGLSQVHLQEDVLSPEELDEKVARLHLKSLGAQLPRLKREQSKYVGIPIEGPYKPNSYRC